MKFKDFQAPVLFSSTFKALNSGEKMQVLSRTFKDAWEPWLDAKADMVVKAADVRRMGILQRKLFSAIIWGSMSGGGDCPGFPLKCCFMTTR